MEKRSNSLAIVSLIFGIIGLLTCCLGIGIVFDIVAVVCGIIALVKNQNKGMSITGIITGGLGLVLCILVLVLGGISSIEDALSDDDISPQPTTSEPTTEEYTYEEYTEEPELTKEEFEQQAVEVTYEDLFRNPETYRDKPIKITVYIEQYDTAYLGFVTVYYASINGQDIYLEDTRTVVEPTIAKGDTVLIYGYGSGLATLTESQKNIIGLTTDSEKSQIPSVDIKYCELQ